MFCSNCGAQASGGSFCSSCGAKLATNAAPPEPTAVPPSPVQQSQFPVAPQPTFAQQEMPSWQTPSEPQGYGYQPVGEIVRKNVFHTISKISLLGVALALFMGTLMPLVAITDFWPFADRLEFFFAEEEIWNTVLTLIFGSVAIVLSLISVPAWIRWVTGSLITSIFIGVIYPLRDAAYSFGEFQVTSPIENLFNNLEWLGDYADSYGPIWVIFWVLSMLLLQFAPLGLIAGMLGATIKAKRLA